MFSGENYKRNLIINRAFYLGFETSIRIIFLIFFDTSSYGKMEAVNRLIDQNARLFDDFMKKFKPRFCQDHKYHKLVRISLTRVNNTEKNNGKTFFHAQREILSASW